MSSALVLGVAQLAADRRTIKVRQLGDTDAIDAVSAQEIGALDQAGALTFAIVLGLPFLLLGLYLDWLRFRDGTKWERVGQVGGIALRLFAIPLRGLDSAYPSAALVVASDAADAAAAISQMTRGKHHIANGLALAGDVLTIATIGMYAELLQTLKKSESGPSQITDPNAAPQRDLPANVAGFG